MLAFSQNYGKVEYMGKEIHLNSTFFQDFYTAYKEKWYAYECQNIYYSVVDLLKDESTIIKIDEAKRLSWKSNRSFPYCDNCKASKRSKKCAGSIWLQVFIPTLEIYIKYDLKL